MNLAPLPPTPSPLAPLMLRAFDKLDEEKQRATLMPVFKFVQDEECDTISRDELARFLGFYLFHGIWQDLKALVLSYQLREMNHDPDLNVLAEMRRNIFEKFCLCLDEQEALRRDLSKA